MTPIRFAPLLILAGMLATTATLTACKEDAPAAKAAAACRDCGTVTYITEKSLKGTSSGMGAVAGAIIGGVLGHQVGDGKGKQAATGVGVVGGAVVGNEIEKRRNASVYYEVGVRMEDGSTRTAKVDNATGLTQGTRVRVVGENLQIRSA